MRKNEAIEKCAEMVDKHMRGFDILDMCGPRNAMMLMAKKMRELKSR